MSTTTSIEYDPEANDGAGEYAAIVTAPTRSELAAELTDLAAVQRARSAQGRECRGIMRIPYDGPWGDMPGTPTDVPMTTDIQEDGK